MIMTINHCNHYQCMILILISPQSVNQRRPQQPLLAARPGGAQLPRRRPADSQPSWRCPRSLSGTMNLVVDANHRMVHFKGVNFMVDDSELLGELWWWSNDEPWSIAVLGSAHLVGGYKPSQTLCLINQRLFNTRESKKWLSLKPPTSCASMWFAGELWKRFSNRK